MYSHHPKLHIQDTLNPSDSGLTWFWSIAWWISFWLSHVLCVSWQLWWRIQCKVCLGMFLPCLKLTIHTYFMCFVLFTCIDMQYWFHFQTLSLLLAKKNCWFCPVNVRAKGVKEWNVFPCIILVSLQERIVNVQEIGSILEKVSFLETFMGGVRSRAPIALI